MTMPRENVRRILREWKGADAADEASPNAVAEQIDEVYREYLDSLPGATAAMLAGQEAQELMVA